MTKLHVSRYIWPRVLSCALHAPLRWSTVSPAAHPALPVALFFTISVSPSVYSEEFAGLHLRPKMYAIACM